MIQVNGKAMPAAGRTVAQLLADTRFDPARVAVERNGEIVPRGRYGDTVLEEGDRVEVVSFVGGG